MIQKNLLAAFPEQAAAIDTFFNGGLRQVSIRATTSCVFRYAPPTRPINLFLLAEEDRKKILDMEAKARTETAQMAQQQLHLLNSNATAAGAAGDQTAALTRVISPEVVLQEEEEELLGI